MPKIETEEQRQAREVVETIAFNLTQLSKQVKALISGPLKKKSLVILLAHSASMPQYQVDKVLTAIADLEKDHINK